MLFTGFSTVGLVLCAVCYFIRMFGITAGYHRYFSHRTFKTSRFFQFILAWLGCSSIQKGPLWWTAHHRHHHRYSDHEGDPHSPRTRSVWYAHIGWILSADTTATDWRMVRDWAKFPELRFLNYFHWLPGVVMAGVCFLIGGWTGLVFFFISTVLLYHATFLVNSVCHLFGKKRYVTNDESRNNAFVALLTGGEGWHNNHHHYQNSARQGFYWWEIDTSYYVLKVLSWFGIVWDIRQPPAKVLEASKQPAPASTSS